MNNDLQRKGDAFGEASTILKKLEGVYIGENIISMEEICELKDKCWKFQFFKYPGPYIYKSIQELQTVKDDAALGYYIRTIGKPTIYGISWLDSIGEEGIFTVPLDHASCYPDAIPYNRCILAFGHPYFNSRVALRGFQMIFYRELEHNEVDGYREALNCQSTALNVL